MHKKEKPIIESFSEDMSFTEVQFWPDFEKFSMKRGLDKDTIWLFERRVYDIWGSTRDDMKVYLNGERIKIQNFKDYVDLYLDDGQIKIYDKCKRWEVCFAESDGQFNQISFVNSIYTLKEVLT